VNRKPRIFYLAWTPPSENGGACLAMRRHLIEHDEFELFVASSTQFDYPSIPSLQVKRGSNVVGTEGIREHVKVS